MEKQIEDDGHQVAKQRVEVLARKPWQGPDEEWFLKGKAKEMEKDQMAVISYRQN